MALEELQETKQLVLDLWKTKYSVIPAGIISVDEDIGGGSESEASKVR